MFVSSYILTTCGAGFLLALPCACVISLIVVESVIKEDVAQSLSIKIMPLKSGAQVIIACEKRPKPIGLSGAAPIKGAFGSTNYPIDSHFC